MNYCTLELTIYYSHIFDYFSLPIEMGELGHVSPWGPLRPESQINQIGDFGQLCQLGHPGKLDLSHSSLRPIECTRF